MQPSLSCATSRSEVPTLLTSRSHRPTSSIHDQFLSIPVDRTVPILMLSRCQIGARQGTRSDPRSGILRIPKFAFFRVLEVSLEKSQFFTPRVDPEFEHFLRSNSVTPRGAGGARIRTPTRGVNSRSQPSSVGACQDRLRQGQIRHPGTGWSDPVLGQGLATSVGRRQRRVGDARSGTLNRVPDRALRHVDLRVPDRHS
jgi:hypothetical protein